MSGDFLKRHAKEWRDFRPELFDCDFLTAEGLRPVFYSGWKGTRVFAWIGLPEGACARHPVPGIVLVHGGGGTAFSHWVQFWNRLGYAAIAMDNCGGMPLQNHQIAMPEGNWPRHRWSGPAGWGAADQWDRKPEDQWFPHAVSSVIFAHNVLRAMPEVDPARIGITGVSWGGVLTCIAAGIDPRFRAAAPVYGSGCLQECSMMQKEGVFDAMSPEASDWWQKEWDPVNFAADIAMPSLWFASTNDFTFYPKQWMKTNGLIARAPVYRSMQIRWPHGHGIVGEEMPELVSFFAEQLKGEGHFPLVGDPVITDNVISAPYSGAEPYSATLIVTSRSALEWLPVRGMDQFLTRDTKYPVQIWHAVSAEIDRGARRLRARLPEGWQNAFLAAITEDLQESTSAVCFRWEGRFPGDGGTPAGNL